MDIKRLISTVSLPQLSIEEAIESQFRLVDTINKYLPGDDFLSNGDLGLVHDLSGCEMGSEGSRPRHTALVEKVLADFFHVEDAVLVPGAGTGAIRAALTACASPGDRVLVHAAPTYKTTEATLNSAGVLKVRVDLNDEARLLSVLENEDIPAAVVQHIPQQPGDNYDLGRIISCIRRVLGARCTIIIDDNYAVFRVPRIGVELGADLSAFSLFKLLGSPLVGCVLGPSRILARIRKALSSGGSQIQGIDALNTLRGLVYCPVALAIQNEVTQKVAVRVNSLVAEGRRPWADWVDSAHSLQCSHRNVVVVLRHPVAKELLTYCWKRGAASHPVGEESRYEVGPLFYRLSSNFLEADPELEDYCFRVNPFRSGPETILRILEKALSDLATARRR